MYIPALPNLSAHASEHTEPWQEPLQTSSNRTVAPGVYIELVAKMSFFSVMAVVGTVGNLVVIVMVLWTKLLWKPASFYMLSLSVADLLLCLVYAPYCLHTVIRAPRPAVCEAMGLLMNLALIASYLSLAAMALNRALLVWLSEPSYAACYSNRRTALSLLAIWVVVLACNCPLLLGYGSVGLERRSGLCTVSMTSPSGAFLYELLLVVLVGMPCFFIILVSYACIWRMFQRRRRSTTHTGPSPPRSVQHSRDNYKLTRNLFIITAVFCVCWLPNLLLVFVDEYCGDIGHQVILLLALSHSLLHPYVYILLNRNLGSAYRSLVRRVSRNASPPSILPL